MLDERELTSTPDPNIKYIIVGKKVIKLIRNTRGLFQDPSGTEYALARNDTSKDIVVRIGVGWFSLPEDNILTPAAIPHDFKYSCPAYQLYHTRSEADIDLIDDTRQAGEGTVWASLAWPFYGIVRIFGGLPGKLALWENKESRW